MSRNVLVNAPPGYRLNVADVDCDIRRFVIEKSAGVQEAAAGRFSEASRHLSAALAQWRGAVLEDLRDFQIVDAFAKALIDDRMVAHTARAGAEIACGPAYAVLAELESSATTNSPSKSSPPRGTTTRYADPSRRNTHGFAVTCARTH